ncbi:MAG: acylphosphatase [Blastocatellia bacterium]
MNAASPIAVTTTARLRLVIRGAVQGVGFRPFVYRLATELGLTGWVNNSAQGVFIEVEGAPPILHNFLLRITTERPPRAVIQSLESAFLDPCGYADFTIRHSEDGGAKTALVLPDIAVCADCLADVRDPRNRRYRYPFTNCTNCGPRFSIIDALPYDRAHTTMKHFAMCAECQAEYENLLDRRFHATAECLSALWAAVGLMWNAAGQPLATKHEALLQAAAALRTGKIVMVKGLAASFPYRQRARSGGSVGTTAAQASGRKPLAFAVSNADRD